MASFSNSFAGDNYGPINQAGHDLNVVGAGASLADALAAAGRLRAVLAGLDVPATERRAAEADLEALEREMRAPAPDRARMAGGLARLTETLKTAGALAAAGTALLGPIGAIAGFLGPAAAGIADLARR